jgi:hypothetical protein
MGSPPAQEAAHGNRLLGMRRPYPANRQCNSPVLTRKVGRSARAGNRPTSGAGSRGESSSYVQGTMTAAN